VLLPLLPDAPLDFSDGFFDMPPVGLRGTPLSLQLRTDGVQVNTLREPPASSPVAGLFWARRSVTSGRI
jgi:hypothetical protein